MFSDTLLTINFGLNIGAIAFKQVCHILKFAALPLKELYCEENPLLNHIPVHSVQEEEVLSLKVNSKNKFHILACWFGNL